MTDSITVAQKIAAQLSIISDSDQISAFLKMQLVLGDADPAKVLAAYQEIKDHKLKVVKVASSLELSNEQKTSLETKLKSKFSKEVLVFAYVIETSVNYGLQITLGDDLIEFSFS